MGRIDYIRQALKQFYYKPKASPQWNSLREYYLSEFRELSPMSDDMRQMMDDLK